MCLYKQQSVGVRGRGKRESKRFSFLEKKILFKKNEVFVEKIMIYNCFKFKFYIEMGGHTSSARGL